WQAPRIHEKSSRRPPVLSRKSLCRALMRLAPSHNRRSARSQSHGQFEATQGAYFPCHAIQRAMAERRPADHRSRARRWQDAVAQLSELQAQYADWLEALPANQHDSALAEALQAICELDLSELESVAPPRGFGRD